VAGNEVFPFEVAIPEADLHDLRERLDRTRWAQEIAGPGWDYGMPGNYVRKLAAYWRNGYDWRAWEARFNEFPQFTTTIDRQRIHFLHIRSRVEGAVPLIVTHGWPGSFVEWLDVIGPLSDPAAGGSDGPAFDLVIPSLPGYGFSGPTTERGWNTRRIAAAWAELMSRLGYESFGAVGNDWGSDVSLELARAYPERVVGAHVTQLFSLPDGVPGELDDPTPEEQAAIDDMKWADANMTYDRVQSLSPQTIAHALADSPVGLLAWNSQIFASQLVDDDFILTNVTLYWLTGTTASAMRLYRENATAGRATTPTTIPVALAQFSLDFKAIRRLVERDHKNVVSWHVFDQPGHFAAHQSPELLVGDIRAFFDSIKSSAAGDDDGLVLGLR
jgi:pimeloyl-ACP methyl ester carboxylesterase